MREQAFTDFRGGLNTVSSLEQLKDTEVTNISNRDLGLRGGTYRRHGMSKHIEPTTKGKAQGFFRFYRDSKDYDDLVAIDGKIEKNGEVLPIEGLEQFQTERPIEAVQFGPKMYFATGTKLVEYDGETLKVVEPYRPEPLEALYIGTNALADNPNDFIKDGEALSFRIDGVTFSSRYGYVNEIVKLTAYKSIPSGKEVEFKFEYRHVFMEEGKWVIGQDWGESNQYDFKTDIEGEVQFRINMREKGLEVAEAQYLVPKFRVKPIKEAGDEVDASKIHTCTKIILHWKRLIMYDDSEQNDKMYISELDNPNYFPMHNTFEFHNPKTEKLVKLVQFRDMIVAFTRNTVQALYGKSPLEFRRYTLNTNVGCIASETAKVMDNVVVFLSEKGIYYLRYVGDREDLTSVDKLDLQIANVVKRSDNACAVFYGNQYQIVYPDENKRLRYYTELKAWVKDDSEKFSFDRLYAMDNTLYAQGVDGVVYYFDAEKLDDDGFIYEDMLETKFHDFGLPYDDKKMKQVELLISPLFGNITMTAKIYADSAEVTNADQSHANVDNDGSIVWNVKYVPNVKSDEKNVSINTGAVLGDWMLGVNTIGLTEYEVEQIRIQGRCKRLRMKLTHNNAVQNIIMGYNVKFNARNR
jgi:hypothetical protein